jgi:hypothetical protein
MSNPNKGISFDRIPTASDAKISLKRLNGCRMFLLKFMREHKRKEIVDYLLKLSVYEFQDISKDFAPSGIADVVRQLAKSGKTYGPNIAAAARELITRWHAGNMQPGLLVTPLAAAAAAARPPQTRRGPVPIDYTRIHRNNVVFQKMMRGITKTKTPGASPKLRKDVKKLACNVHGHNNIAIGKWWAFREAVRRDGAHAETRAGIHGNLAAGAFSIVASGDHRYEGADKDEGDVLWYCGPMAAGAAMSTGSQLLAKSQKTQMPVRVIRGAAGTAWSPDVGYRYDGLYRVESYVLEKRKSSKKEQFWRFKLVRLEGQESLGRVYIRSPTQKEREAFYLY